MSPHQPDGVAWPANGSLVRPVVGGMGDVAIDGQTQPSGTSATSRQPVPIKPGNLAEPEAHRPLSFYLHVPFCTVRCGYCDFNTYTTEFGQGADRVSFATSLLAEMDLARRVLDEAGVGHRNASTVFFGGGTPTLLPASALTRALAGIQERWGLAEGAEVTTEANPETVSPEYFTELARAGFTRVSIGMQSAVPHVLTTLDRTHSPERVPHVVQWAKDAGLDISVDLIYGTPGESLSDWRTSLEAALAMEPDHISAYALVVEEGTKMGAQVARGVLPTPDPDDEADKYELADALLGGAGYAWYEISNFARRDSDEHGQNPTLLRHASQHNLAYWRDWDWWGFGPGAHSHVGRARWWNVKHPLAYAGKVRSGLSPAAAGEILDASTRELERVMLSVRTAEGLPIDERVDRLAVPELISQGLIDGVSAIKGQRIVLTLRGRLMADLVTHRLLLCED